MVFGVILGVYLYLMVPTCVCGCLWVSEGAYRYLRAPTVAHWCQRVPNGVWRYLRCLLVSDGAHLCLWLPMGV